MKVSTITVKGYRGKITLDDVKQLVSREIYLFNAKTVVGMEHLIYVYEKAKKVFREGRNIANNLHIEMMLILTGKRQIKEALTMASPVNTEEFVAISPEDFQLPFERDDRVIECKKEKLEHLGIQIPAWMEKEKRCLFAFENSALLELVR